MNLKIELNMEPKIVLDEGFAIMLVAIRIRHMLEKARQPSLSSITNKTGVLMFQLSSFLLFVSLFIYLQHLALAALSTSLLFLILVNFF